MLLLLGFFSFCLSCMQTTEHLCYLYSFFFRSFTLPLFMGREKKQQQRHTHTKGMYTCIHTFGQASNKLSSNITESEQPVKLKSKTNEQRNTSHTTHDMKTPDTQKRLTSRCELLKKTETPIIFFSISLCGIFTTVYDGFKGRGIEGK